MEEIADHVDTSVLDVGGLRILLVIDEVLGERLRHELFGFIFLWWLLVKLFKCIVGLILVVALVLFVASCHPQSQEMARLRYGRGGLHWRELDRNQKAERNANDYVPCKW